MSNASQLPDWFTEAGMKERDMACMLLPDLDYDAQLVAIRHVIADHREVGDRLTLEIQRIDQFARKCAGHQNARAVDEWLELMQASTYQGAAHSMAAVGMIAPLAESVFCSVFRELRQRLHSHQTQGNAHPRLTAPSQNRWDCYLFWNDGKYKRDLVSGIMQLADAVGMIPHLPPDMEPTIRALFEYRNKMFHCGFEWPAIERERFHRRLANGSWPADWFSMATRNNEPWIFYLTDTYIDHCIKTLEGVIAGIGGFCTRVLVPRLQA